MKIIPRIIGFAGTLFIALQAGQAIAGGPAVVASIKPVHSLVAGVMTGIGEPELLVDGTASEHDYALRPSQAKALTQADLIFWVGPQLETFLIRPLTALAPSAGQVALSTSAGVQLLPVRDADTLREAQSVTDEKSHDMHIWLDPDNAAAMVREIAAQLQARDPGNATIYAKNAAALEVRLLASKHMIKARLDAMPTPPYMVFHDAYQYFEARFGLRPVAIISLDPERPPGAGRIRKLRRTILDANVACVFAEPQFEPRLIQTLTEGTPAKTAILDPLGAELHEGSGMYFMLLEQLAGSLTGCKAEITSETLPE